MRSPFTSLFGLRASTRASMFAMGLLLTSCAPDNNDDGVFMGTANDGAVAPVVVPDTGVALPMTQPTVPMQTPIVPSTPIPTDAGIPSDATVPPVVDTGVPPSTSGAEPTIPKPAMACPSFKSGSMNIFGLSAEVIAGPKSTGAKGPLVIYWHGTGGSGAEAAATLPAAVRQEIMSMGGMIVAPTATTMKGDDVTFILGVWFTPGDYEWADNVAACAIQDYNIDPRRIYATGCSAGGLATGVMAFQRSNYLAAAVPNSGGVAVPGQDKAQDPKRVTPTMTMHGAAGSDVVIVDFSETSASLATSSKAKGGFVIDCNHGGGHCGSPAALQTAAWQFMKDHPYGVSPEPYAKGLPSSFPSYCKIQ